MILKKIFECIDLEINEIVEVFIKVKNYFLVCMNKIVVENCGV